MVWKLTLSLVGLLAVFILQMDMVDSSRKSSALILLAAYSVVLFRAWRKEKSQQPVQSGVDYLIAFATETGTARKLARQTLKQIKQNKQTGQVIELNDLLNAPRPNKGLLVIASTSGQGDAPRTGRDWLQQELSSDQFEHLPYAILALGDRNYRQFCGFGLKVDSVLRAAGGKPMFDMLMVSQANEEQLKDWLNQVALHTQT